MAQTNIDTDPDPFYSPENIARCKKSTAQLESSGGAAHDVGGDGHATRLSTKELFEEFYHKPFSEITAEDLGEGSEIDWGEELWDF